MVRCSCCADEGDSRMTIDTARGLALQPKAPCPCRSRSRESFQTLARQSAVLPPVIRPSAVGVMQSAPRTFAAANECQNWARISCGSV